MRCRTRSWPSSRGTSHFLTQEKPELVNELVVDFLTKEPAPTVAPIRRAPKPETSPG